MNERLIKSAHKHKPITWIGLVRTSFDSNTMVTKGVIGCSQPSYPDPSHAAYVIGCFALDIQPDSWDANTAGEPSS